MNERTFVILFLAISFTCIFILSMEDAEGAVVESVFNETDTYWNDFSGNQKFTHTKDDYIVIPFCNDDGDVMVAYRERGGSWSYSEVCAFDFAGASSWKLGALINTDNNSLVLMADALVGSYYRVYYFTKFAGDDWDEWDPLLFLYQSSVHFFHGDHAINDTGIILGMARKSIGNVWTYRLFDFEAYTLNDNDNGLAWETGTGSSAGFQIEANHTGKFWISWKHSDNVYYVRDFEKDLAMVAWDLNGVYTVNTMAFLDNGVLVGVGNTHSGVSDWPFYFYQTVPGDPMTKIKLDPISSRVWNYMDQIVVRTGSTVPVIIAYSETDETLYTFGANYDASEATWQGSRSDTGISSADEYMPLGASNSLWPSHVSSGINWTRATAGWAITIEDDDPAPDTFYYMHDGANWSVDLTTSDPEITTESLPDATYGVFWEHTLTKTGGTIPFVWTTLIKPDWMFIGAINGTLYGTPDTTGSETVRVRLADAVPRYDERQWTLKIKEYEAPPEPPLPPGRKLDFPVSLDTLIGWMWWIFMFMAMFIAVMDVVMKVRKKGSGGVI